MRISAKSDYAVRAAVVLAVADSEGPVKAEAIERSQEIPLKFLLNILSELKHGRIVTSHRGALGVRQLAGRQVGDRDPFEHRAQARPYRDPDLLQGLGGW